MPRDGQGSTCQNYKNSKFSGFQQEADVQNDWNLLLLNLWIEESNEYSYRGHQYTPLPTMSKGTSSCPPWLCELSQRGPPTVCVTWITAGDRARTQDCVRHWPELAPSKSSNMLWPGRLASSHPRWSANSLLRRSADSKTAPTHQREHQKIFPSASVIMDIKP